MRLIVGILAIIDGLIIMILGILPQSAGSSVQLGNFWPQFAGSYLLQSFSVPDQTITLIAFGLSILAGLCMIFAGLGILEIINFGELIEEFTFLAILLSIILFVLFFHPYTIIGIIFSVLLGLYMMFR